MELHSRAVARDFVRARLMLAAELSSSWIPLESSTSFTPSPGETTGRHLMVRCFQTEEAFTELPQAMVRLAGVRYSRSILKVNSLCCTRSLVWRGMGGFPTAA